MSLLTIEEAAEYLRLHPSTVYRLARSGELPVKKVGKQWRLHKESLDRWLRIEAKAEIVPADANNQGSS